MSNPSIMTISVLLISGKGRIPRSTYWLKYFAPYLVIYSMMVLVDIAAGTFDARHWGIFRDLHSSRVVAIDGVSVKRCHERNRLGWFLRRCNLTDRFSSLGKISGLGSLVVILHIDCHAGEQSASRAFPASECSGGRV
jgi:uncharacterized membrane protein YhaH (DUF805 family)